MTQLTRPTEAFDWEVCDFASFYRALSDRNPRNKKRYRARWGRKRLSIAQAGSHSRGGLSEQLAHPRLGDAKEHGDALQLEATVES